MFDFTQITNGIREIVTKAEPVLLSLPDEIVSGRYNNQDRNIKMLLGHLVDSASNNQQRMVRLQYAPRCGWSMPDANVGMLVFPDYTQDNDLWIPPGLQELSPSRTCRPLEMYESPYCPHHRQSGPDTAGQLLD